MAEIAEAEKARPHTSSVTALTCQHYLDELERGVLRERMLELGARARRHPRACLSTQGIAAAQSVALALQAAYCQPRHGRAVSARAAGRERPDVGHDHATG